MALSFFEQCHHNLRALKRYSGGGVRLIELIQHDSDIYALAVSKEEKLLACGGGGTAVTIWNLKDRTLVSRLVGLNHQVQALAFSPDGIWLATTDIWGGLCVWRVEDGRLLEQKPAGTSRKYRSLIYPETAKKSHWPVMLSESIHSQMRRVLAPDGKLLAVKSSAIEVKIRKYRTKMELSKLDLSRYAVTRSGARTVAWSTDSQALGLAGQNWVGIWLPLAQTPLFYAQKFSPLVEIDALVVLKDPLRLIYAEGKTAKMIDIKSKPMLTEWQIFLSQIPELAEGSDFQGKHDWTWDVTQWGHEGVHTFEAGQLVWYSHSHNPHAGGGATMQSFADFLENGPTINQIPEELLLQVCQVVRQFAK